MAVTDQVEPDGRRARRERGREAVIDAVYALLQEGAFSLATEAIVERSGVSLSSIFRYFDTIDDLQQQTIARHFERSAPLFEVPAIGEGVLGDRIRRLVDARLALYEAIAPIGRLARARALELPVVARTLVQTRVRFADQVAQHFGPEVARLAPAAGHDLVMLLASMTSFEAWDVLTESHHRSRVQIRRAWTTGLRTLLA